MPGKYQNERTFIATGKISGPIWMVGGKAHMVLSGHYARVARVPHAQRLCRGADHNKDQSYFLSSLAYNQVRRVSGLRNMPRTRLMGLEGMLPAWSTDETWVRQLAKYYGLPTASREESMGLCFVGERRNFGDFVCK